MRFSIQVPEQNPSAAPPHLGDTALDRLTDGAVVLAITDRSCRTSRVVPAKEVPVAAAP